VRRSAAGGDDRGVVGRLRERTRLDEVDDRDRRRELQRFLALPARGARRLELAVRGSARVGHLLAHGRKIGGDPVSVQPGTRQRSEANSLGDSDMISRGRGAPTFGIIKAAADAIEIVVESPASAAPADAIAPERSDAAGVSTRFLDQGLASPRAA
jgi:hypothetical protein